MWQFTYFIAVIYMMSYGQFLTGMCNMNSIYSHAIAKVTNFD